jgi:hypothetical protein
MGCGNTRTLIEGKIEKRSSRKSSVKTKMMTEDEYIYDDEVKKRAFSINQSIFICEKDFSEFKYKYVIVKRIGTGIK